MITLLMLQMFLLQICCQMVILLFLMTEEEVTIQLQGFGL